MKNHTTNKVCLFRQRRVCRRHRGVIKRLHPTGFSRHINYVPGFTLIEVMIAMALLTIGTLALLSALGGGLLQRETSREYDIARNAAAAKLEEIRGRDFTNVFAQYNLTYFDVPGLTARAGWTSPGKIVKIVKVAGVEVENNGIDNTVANLYEVTITIRWQIKGNTDSRVFNEFVIRSLMTRNSKY